MSTPNNKSPPHAPLGNRVLPKPVAPKNKPAEAKMDELVNEFIGWCAVVLTVGLVAYLFHVSYSDAGFVLAVAVIALVVLINLRTRFRSR